MTDSAPPKGDRGQETGTLRLIWECLLPWRLPALVAFGGLSILMVMLDDWRGRGRYSLDEPWLMQVWNVVRGRWAGMGYRVLDRACDARGVEWNLSAVDSFGDSTVPCILAFAGVLACFAGVASLRTLPGRVCRTGTWAMIVVATLCPLVFIASAILGGDEPRPGLLGELCRGPWGYYPTRPGLANLHDAGLMPALKIVWGLGVCLALIALRRDRCVVQGAMALALACAIGVGSSGARADLEWYSGDRRACHELQREIADKLDRYRASHGGRAPAPDEIRGLIDSTYVAKYPGASDRSNSASRSGDDRCEHSFEATATGLGCRRHGAAPDAEIGAARVLAECAKTRERIDAALDRYLARTPGAKLPSWGPEVGSRLTALGYLGPISHPGYPSDPWRAFHIAEEPQQPSKRAYRTSCSAHQKDPRDAVVPEEWDRCYAYQRSVARAITRYRKERGFAFLRPSFYQLVPRLVEYGYLAKGSVDWDPRHDRFQFPRLAPDGRSLVCAQHGTAPGTPR